MPAIARRPRGFQHKAAPVVRDAARLALEAEWLASIEAYAWQLAIRCRRRFPTLDIDDLASEARAGFVAAAARFDPTRGVKFISYATHWGRCYLRKYAQHAAASGVHVPHYLGPRRVGHESIDWSARGYAESFAEGIADRPPATTTPEFPPDFWQRVRGWLTDVQWAAVEMVYCRGLTMRQAARLLGANSHQVIAGRLKQAKDRLRDDPTVLRYLTRCHQEA